MGWRSRGYRDYDSWYPRFPKSTPRAAKGGIKAQSKRGAFGQSWWAKRWIAVLESFQIGARLGRGRSYARKGQVLSVDISEGQIAAKVQGSRPKPYEVSIKVKTLSKADWKKLAETFSQQAIFAAKLLAGEMPQNIEDAFKQTKLSLFPAKLGDLATNCSCPDWSNPCKHIAAVYYLLGEEFDRDPFLVFRLRGIEREELVRLIGQGEAESGPATKEATEGAKEGMKKRAKKTASRAKVAVEEESAAEVAPPEPLSCDLDSFWGKVELPDDWFGEVRVPPVAAAPCKRLGSLPFWRAATSFLDFVEPVYNAASPAGMNVFLGQQ